MTATTEPFTAVAMCPKCADVAVHWIKEPRRKPPGWDESPAGKLSRRISDTVDYLMSFGIAEPIAEYRDPEPPSPFEPDDATIARECRNCKHQWGQR